MHHLQLARLHWLLVSLHVSLVRIVVAICHGRIHNVFIINVEDIPLSVTCLVAGRAVLRFDSLVQILILALLPQGALRLVHGEVHLGGAVGRRH